MWAIAAAGCLGFPGPCGRPVLAVARRVLADTGGMTPLGLRETSPIN